MKRYATDRIKACAFVRSSLIFVAEKEIQRARPPEIQNHLDSCTECALIVQQFVRAWKNLAPQEEVPPSAGFFPNLIKRIEIYEEQNSGRNGILWAVRKILRPVAVAALFLAGIFAGHDLGKTGKFPALPEESLTGRYLDGFENIPRDSVADFYISHQDLRKEDRE
jgi:hypothetical protein